MHQGRQRKVKVGTTPTTSGGMREAPLGAHRRRFALLPASRHAAPCCGRGPSTALLLKSSDRSALLPLPLLLPPLLPRIVGSSMLLPAEIAAIEAAAMSCCCASASSAASRPRVEGEQGQPGSAREETRTAPAQLSAALPPPCHARFTVSYLGFGIHVMKCYDATPWLSNTDTPTTPPASSVHSPEGGRGPSSLWYRHSMVPSRETISRPRAHHTPGRPSSRGSTPSSSPTAVPAAITMAPAGGGWMVQEERRR